VLLVDVGDDRDRGHQHQERPVTLVGLGDQVLRGPHARVAAELRHPSSDERGRVEPACSSITATMADVVVLPCAPAMAMPKRGRMISASMSPRPTTGMPRRLASTISGLLGRTADDATTTSTSPRCDAAWPT
jgi:hypothetical protein